VSDTGQGMDRETLSHLFEPFFTTKEKGTGLGLSTVYGIVTQSKGAISVDSRQGEGSRFTVTFPRHENAPAATLTAAPPPHPTHPVHPALLDISPADDHQNAMTILVVEDEEAVRTFAANVLRNNGYTVITAASGADALEALRDGVVAHGMHFIHKPFSPSELLGKLRDVIPPRKDGGPVETRARM